MRIMRKAPLGILLGIALILGLLPGMTTTALAANNGLYVNNAYANTTTSGTGWSFDVATNTLTLENYSFNGVGSAPPTDSTVIMYYPKNGTLTIELKGTNTIVQGDGTNRTWWGIYCRSNLVITGDGTLNIRTRDGGYRGAAIYCEKNVSIEGNCTVNAKSGTVNNGPQGHGIGGPANAVLTIGTNAHVTLSGPKGGAETIVNNNTTAPSISQQPTDLSLSWGYTDGSVSLATADAAEGHTLSYQWYSNTTKSNKNGTVIEGATSESYAIPTGKSVGTTEYYYCVVTATLDSNGQTATTTSNAVEMKVNKATWVKTNAFGSAPAGSEGEVDLAGYIAPGGSLGTPVKRSGIEGESGDPTFSLDTQNKKIAFRFAELSQGNETIASYTIPVTGMANYENYDIIVTVSAPAKRHQKLTFDTETVSKTYTDAAFTKTASRGASDDDYGEPYGAITYVSSNTNVAEVNPSTGEVTIKDVGAAVITATAARTYADSSDQSKPGYLPASASYTLTVSKVPVTAPTIESKIYNEQSQTADVPENSLYTVTANAGGTNVGNYPVELTLSDANHYKWTDSENSTKTLTFTITKAAATVTAPERIELIYTGSAQNLVDAGNAQGGTLNYALDTTDESSGTYSTSIPTATEVGTYQVWYKAVADNSGNYYDSEPGRVLVTISPRSVTLTSATVSKQYDGQPLTNKDVTVTGDGFLEGQGATYEFTGTQTLVGTSPNAFTYTLDEGTKEDNYDITKVEGQLSVTSREAKYEIAPEANSATFPYDGEEHSVSGLVTDKYVVNEVEYTVSGLEAGASGTDAGTYTVNVTGTATVKDPDGNDVSSEFAVVPTTGTLKIEQADANDVSVSLEGWTHGEEPNEPSCTADFGAEQALYDYSDSAEGPFAVTVPTGAGTWYVRATVPETRNYVGGEAVAEFEIAKAPIEPAVTIEGWTAGQPANEPRLAEGSNPGGGAVAYAYRPAGAGDEAWVARVPTEVGDYVVRATVAETANHLGGEATAEFSITPVPTTFTVTLAGGANATADGATEQSIEKSQAMATVTYTANEGFHFDAWAGETKDGVVAELKDGKISVSGTPTADVRLTVPDAVADDAPGPRVTYAAHVAGPGWLPYVSDGETAGTTGEFRRMEALKVKLEGAPVPGTIEYRAHLQTTGWEDSYVADDAVAGTTGEFRRIEAVQMRLTGEMAELYDVWYRVHTETFGWLGWARNDSPAGTTGLFKRAEAIEVRVLPKGSPAPGDEYDSFITSDGVAPEQQVSGHLVSAQAHTQTYGWVDPVYDGATAGTTGQFKRLEALSIELCEDAGPGSIEYLAHLQTYGWGDGQYVADGAVAGTTGEFRRMEAVRIRLRGQAEAKYDVWYRVHSQTYGWLGWACNDQAAGTTGLFKRAEAVQVLLLPKGSPAPGPTDTALITS